MNIVIIGNGAAAVSAAEAARKQNADAQITLFSEDPHLPYFRPRLAEVLADEGMEEKILLHPQDWYDKNNIHLSLDTHVMSIDTQNKKIVLEGGRVPYDKLILATGSKSFVPPIKGVEHKGVYTLWTLDQAKELRSELNKKDNVIVIGGGLLGLEAAWQLHRGGSHVTVIESFDRLLGNQMDEKGSALFKAKVESLGITVFTGASTKEILAKNDQVTGVELSTGEVLPAKAVLVSTGVRARTELAEAAGIQIDRRIVVNNKMETNHPDIYAAGDNAELEGKWYGLWTISTQEGAVAGKNAAGGEAEYVMPVPPYMLNTMDTKVMSAGSLKTDEGQRVELTVDEDKFLYKKLVYKDGELQGFLLMGDTAEGMKLRKELR